MYFFNNTVYYVQYRVRNRKQVPRVTKVTNYMKYYALQSIVKECSPGSNTMLYK